MNKANASTYNFLPPKPSECVLVGGYQKLVDFLCKDDAVALYICILKRKPYNFTTYSHTSSLQIRVRERARFRQGGRAEALLRQTKGPQGNRAMMAEMKALVKTQTGSVPKVHRKSVA